MTVSTRRNDATRGNKRIGVNCKDIVCRTELLDRFTGAHIMAKHQAVEETMSTFLLLQPEPPNTYYLPRERDLHWDWCWIRPLETMLLRFAPPPASYRQTPRGWTWRIKPRSYARAVLPTRLRSQLHGIWGSISHQDSHVRMSKDRGRWTTRHTWQICYRQKL